MSISPCVGNMRMLRRKHFAVRYLLDTFKLPIYEWKKKAMSTMLLNILTSFQLMT